MSKYLKGALVNNWINKITENEDNSLTIERDYDDFEFLHHVLTTHNQIIGLIVPSDRLPECLLHLLYQTL